ncbi:MAG TPA: RICIN domain-containing protein [Pseudonocardiaceae bacterium]|nr:RICIN domain-containing protein [Pseudonocardiaceae bacterium]
MFEPQSNGSLYNPQSGKCLDDPNSSTTEGTQLQIYDCNGTNAQQWHLP